MISVDITWLLARTVPNGCMSGTELFIFRPGTC